MCFKVQRRRATAGRTLGMPNLFQSLEDVAGTFKSEKEVAMAYDSAALKLRNSGDTRRNFPVTPTTSPEPKFQCNYSMEAVLNMIKDSTYQSRFVEFIAQTVGTDLSLNILSPRTDNGGLLCKMLFHKELTPSHVSKLNRLVIPKSTVEFQVLLLEEQPEFCVHKRVKPVCKGE